MTDHQPVSIVMVEDDEGHARLFLSVIQVPEVGE